MTRPFPLPRGVTEAESKSHPLSMHFLSPSMTVGEVVAYSRSLEVEGNTVAQLGWIRDEAGIIAGIRVQGSVR